jgi:N-terminal acetyltransferase B complex non-catalytic subunit
MFPLRDSLWMEKLTRIQDRWVKSARVTDRLFSLLKTMAAQKPVKLETELPALEQLTLSDTEDIEPDMTAAEQDNAKIHLALLKVVCLLNDPKSIQGEDFEGLLTQVEDWLTSALDSVSSDATAFADTTIHFQSGKPSVPSWLYLHNSFTVLETLKAVSLILSVSSSKKSSKSAAKLPKERGDRLGELVGQVYEAIKSNTRVLKSHIAEPGMLGALIDLVLIGESNAQGGQLHKELENTLDAGALEVFCGELMESWEEGLDGILSVAI